MFFHKSEEKASVSDEVRTYFERITLLEARVTSLELNEQAFRDKVLRKIQKRDENEELKPRLTAGAKVRR